MECIYCKGQCIKSGKYKTTQRYQCKDCKRYQQEHYKKFKIPPEKYEWVVKLSNEGNSISSISRLLNITKSGVQRLIIRISSKIKEAFCEEVMYFLKINGKTVKFVKE